MSLLLQTLFPIFGVIGLGYLLVRWGFFDAHVVKGLNSLVYWIGLPCLLVLRLVNADFSSGGYVEIGGALILATLVSLLLAWGAARLVKLPTAYMGTYLQASFRGNLAFIALPVVNLTFLPFGDTVARQMETLLILAMAPTMVFFNITSTLVLIAGTEDRQQGKMRKLFYPLLRNPILLASAFGALIGALQIPVPLAIQRSLSTLAGIALPLALLCIGCSLYLVSSRGKMGYALLASGFKTVVAPLVGVTVVWLLNLPGYVGFIVVLMLSCPTATVSYVFSKQLGGDEALASGCIVVSTVISLVTLGILLLVAGTIGMQEFLPPLP